MLTGSGQEGANADDEWIDIGEDSRLDAEEKPVKTSGTTNITNDGYGQSSQFSTLFPVSGNIESMDVEISSSQTFSPTTANMSKRRPGKSRAGRNNGKDDHDGFQSESLSGSPAMQGVAGISNSPVVSTSNTISQPLGALNQAGGGLKGSGSHMDDVPTNSNLAYHLQSISVPPAPAASAKRKSKTAARPTKASNGGPSQSYGPVHDSSHVIPQKSGSSEVISVPPVTGGKRKRAPRPKSTPAAIHDGISNLSSIATLSEAHDKLPQGKSTVSASLGGILPQNSVQAGRESPILPPPKRQRKPKDFNGAPVKRKPTSLAGSPAIAATSNISQPPLHSPVSNVTQQPSPLRQPTPKQQTTPMQQASSTSHTNSMQTSSIPQVNTSQQPLSMQMSSNPLQQASPMQQSNSHSMLHSSSMQKSNSIQRSTPTQQSTPLQQSSVMQQSTPMQQPITQAMLTQSITQAMINPTMMTSESNAPTSRSSSRPSMSRPLPQGLEAHYDHFAALQQADTQTQTQPHQRIDHTSLARGSPIPSSTLTSSTYYQAPQALQQHSTQQQHHHQQQPSRHMSASAYGQPYTSQQTSNPYQSAATSGNTLYRTAQQQYNTQPAFSSRQQAPQQNQSNYADTSIFDLPALGDNLSSGPASVGQYGQSLSSRSASTGSYGAQTYGNMGPSLQISNGFDSAAGMDENDLRDRLMRNMGGRR